MDSKLSINIFVFFFTIVLRFVGTIKAQQDFNRGNQNVDFSSLNRIFIRVGNSTNSTDRSFLILLPSGLNLSDSRFSATSSDLFKLNTDILLNRGHESIDLTTTGESNGANRASLERESRGVNFLRAKWNKPKTSPLYLINGTVCRFVNSEPICTTLSTTGLLRNPTAGGGGSSSSGGGGGGGGGSGGQQGGAQRPGGASGQSGGGSSVQFVSPRPAGLMEDDAQDINVESVATNFTRYNSADSSDQMQQSTSAGPVVAAIQAARPLNYVINRRPLNLLSMRRPNMGQFQ